MSYTAWEHIHRCNEEEYGISAPKQPSDYRQRKSISSLERDCLDFIRDSCEELRFDPAKWDLRDRDGCSAKPGQIPYNMQMDTDRLCLENAIHRFMSSGMSQDAFDVYFCFLEMFFGSYAKSKKIIEMLAEFESNASVLLMKHRDHYSHSVYVFVLGLAIYRRSSQFRTAYKSAYQLSDERTAAHHYIRHWGMSALFHDIGYPFELPFEQVKNYFGDTIQKVPFVAYRGIVPYLQLSPDESGAFARLLGKPLSESDLNEILSVVVTRNLGRSYSLTSAEMYKILKKKPGHPDAFAGYMDHAYFSAILLLHWLKDKKGARNITLAELDAAAAILLHNSIFKRTIQTKEHHAPLRMEQFPLAYMLMLCDELQCWDRTSYGQNSRQELHAMWCDFSFTDNDIQANYRYDNQFDNEKKKSGGSYKKMQGSPSKFIQDIEKIVCINQEGTLSLKIETSFIKNNRQTKTYLSHSSFLHLYNFAVALNARYQCGSVESIDPSKLEESFNQLSLEYKLSNILQAKAFARYLEAIGCFYTDRPVEYEMLDEFTPSNMDVIGPLEHERWRQEKLSMGWQLDDAYLNMENNKEVRELTRTHSLMVEEYGELDATEQAKDTEPMNYMLRLLEEFDGLRIYRT